MCLLRTVEFLLTSAPLPAVQNTDASLSIFRIRFLYLREVPLSGSASCVLRFSHWSSPLPPVHRHTRTNTQAEARSSTHCAHCSATTDEWWPQALNHPRKLLSIYTRSCSHLSHRWPTAGRVLRTNKPKVVF